MIVKSESRSDNGILSRLGGLFRRGSRGATVLLLAVGLAVLLLGVFLEDRGNTELADEDALLSFREREEETVEQMLGEMRGVGACRVHITLASGETLEMHGSTVVAREPPRVLAIAVLCEGADSEEVRAAIVSLLSTLYSIGSNRVSVQKIK